MIQASAYYGRRREREETAALPLVRRRQTRAPLIVDKHALARLLRPADTTAESRSSRVPRLSTLVRSEAARSTARRRTRKLSWVLAIAFFAGGWVASQDLHALLARGAPAVRAGLGSVDLGYLLR